MKNNENCTMLVCSCDKYSDLWDPFFQLMSINWKDCPYPIVLNTESKSYDCPYFNVKTLGLFKEGRKVPYGKRLRKHLKKIKTEYVLIMLDDFLLYDKVNQSKLDACIAYMDKHKNTAHIRLFDKIYADTNDVGLNGFGKYKKEDYIMSLQAAIWRRKDLMRFTLNCYSPWDFEIRGSKVASKHFKEDFLLQVKGETSLLPYDCYIHGVTGGKWKPETEKLFADFGVIADCSKRGFVKEKNNNYIPPSKWERIKHKFTFHNAMILTETFFAAIYNSFYYVMKRKD